MNVVTIRYIVFCCSFLLVIGGVGLAMLGVAENVSSSPDQFRDFDTFGEHSRAFFAIVAIGFLAFFFAVVGCNYAHIDGLDPQQDLPLDGTFGVSRNVMRTVVWNMLPPASRVRLLRQQQICGAVMMVIVFLIQVAAAFFFYTSWRDVYKPETGHKFNDGFQFNFQNEMIFFPQRKTEPRQSFLSNVAPFLIIAVLAIEVIIIVSSMFIALSIRQRTRLQEAQMTTQPS